jgi:hypothetical protein
VRLADFRTGRVLLPLDEGGGPLTVPFGGIDWICVFTGEDALARFARARDEAGRDWSYVRVAGAGLLDHVIPAVDFPCGIAVDTAGPEPVFYPPLPGLVPDEAVPRRTGASD